MGKGLVLKKNRSHINFNTVFLSFLDKNPKLSRFFQFLRKSGFYFTADTQNRRQKKAPYAVTYGSKKDVTVWKDYGASVSQPGRRVNTVINTEISVFMQDIETQGIIKVLKNCGAYKTTGRGKNKTVFCNPYIWVLVALAVMLNFFDFL